MTDRVLAMLYQYLLSNQALHLNETFQVYCKILSIEHSSFQKKPTARKKKRPTVHVHVGSSRKLYRYPWAIDVPSNEKWKGLCLIICTIFGLLQHLYFETNKKNKLYEYVRRINGLVEDKRKQAEKILADQLSLLFSTTGLKQTGPYELKSTVILLAHTYKCQFFIFDSFNRKSKLYFMYPENYDDSLKPLFFFRPKFDSGHVVFIKKLNSFFNTNYSVCFACFKHFKRKRDSRSSHLCQKKKSCFACRRFFQSTETYTNSGIKMFFCDKLVTEESQFSCPKCNCDLYSNHCYAGHKRFCKGRGYFGYKCSSCNQFTYCTGKLTSEDLKKNHNCTDLKHCKFCYQKKELDHLCPLKFEKVSVYHTRLSFFHIFFDVKSKDPLGALFLREEKNRGAFTYYSYFAPQINLQDCVKFEYLVFDYLLFVVFEFSS